MRIRAGFDLRPDRIDDDGVAMTDGGDCRTPAAVEITASLTVVQVYAFGPFDAGVAVQRFPIKDVAQCLLRDFW